MFVNGPLRQTVGGCGVPRPLPQLATVEFGSHYRTAAQAYAEMKLRRTWASYRPRADQLGCVNYRVVEKGNPEQERRDSILAEACSAHLIVRLVNS